jgi:hypothetical protein
MLMRNRIAILLIGPLVLAVAPFCSAQSDESTHGKSATGRISWEIRPPADNRSSSTIWLWPDDRKDKATQLTETPTFNQIAFSADDAWIVVQSHLSSGSFFSFFRRRPDTGYAEDKAAEDFFENGAMEKMATSEQVERWSVNFEKWTSGFGPYAFIFSWSARLTRRGPDTYFMHCSGWRGIYDLQRRAAVKTLEPCKTTTASEDAEEALNEDYRQLGSLLDEASKERLRAEELAWLSKRDAIKSPQERCDFTNARVTEFESRIQTLKH